MNLNLAVVFEELLPSEAIREKINSGAGRANHLSQYFLSDLGNRLLGFAFLAELREQQQNPRSPLFAEIKS